jgi:hypothetical protein
MVATHVWMVKIHSIKVLMAKSKFGRDFYPEFGKSHVVMVNNHKESKDIQFTLTTDCM